VGGEVFGRVGERDIQGGEERERGGRGGGEKEGRGEGEGRGGRGG